MSIIKYSISTNYPTATEVTSYKEFIKSKIEIVSEELLYKPVVYEYSEPFEIYTKSTITAKASAYDYDGEKVFSNEFTKTYYFEAPPIDCFLHVVVIFTPKEG